MVDKTPHEAMPGSASGLQGYEIMLLARTSPPTVNSIAQDQIFGPNNDQAARGDHSHVIADNVRPGFMSTGDRAKLDALATNRQIPIGGTAGQIMQKVSGTDYAIAWADAPIGGGGSGGGWVQQNTQTALAQTNPIMALGAIGWETDTGRWKIGDGVTAWNSLAYQDMARTPAGITNPGTTASFRFRTNATQTVTFTSAPGGTVTIQAPTSAPPASHEGEMYLRITNNSGSTITIAAPTFQLDGDFLVSSIPTATTQEYTLWVLGGTWYISGGQDLADGSVGNAQLATMPTSRIKGRYTTGTGAVEDLTPNQVRWLIDNAQPNVVSVPSTTTLTKAAHQGKYLLCGATLSLTVDNATDFDQYYEATILADGGPVTVVATATVHAPSGLIIPQYARGVLRREAGTDIYALDIVGHPKVAAADSVAATTAAGTSTLRLVSDTASPGNNKVYGTDGSGVRGWKNDPAGGGGGSTTLGGLTDVADVLAPTNGQVLTYSTGTGLWQSGTVTAPGGSGTVVDTIAALRGIATPGAAEYVFVRGFTSATGIGGGLFQWNAALTDTKTVTNATIAAGGTGYAAGQLVYVATGTATNRGDTLLKVSTVSSGVVTGISLLRSGKYNVAPTASASATGTDAPTGTGLTLDLTIVSYSDGISVAKSGGGTGRWIRKTDQAEHWNIHWFGATGDGVTDDTVAIQTAVDYCVPLYFPPGLYIATSAITWWPNNTLNIRGAGIYGPDTSRIALTSNTDEPLFHIFGRYMKQDGTYQFEVGWELDSNNLGGGGSYVHVENLHFQSQSSIYGSCFEAAHQQDGWFSNCSFEGSFRGLTLAQAQFDVVVINCRFMSNFMMNFPWAGTTGGTANRIIAERAWGLYSSGHKTIINCSIVGYGCGFQCCGITNNLIGSRIEVNNYGIILGNIDYRFGGPSTGLVSRSTFRGISLEANTIGICIRTMRNCDFQSIAIQGSETDGAFRPEGEYGLLIEQMDADNTISGIGVQGYFNKFSIMNLSRYPIWRADAGNVYGRTFGGTNTPFLNVAGNRPFAHCLATPTPIGRLTFFSDFQQEGLTQLNLRAGGVNARNLGGSVTVAQGATTAAVTFQAEVGIATIAINTIGTVADGTSTLTTATYYYATTVIGWNAEVGVILGNATIHNYRNIAVTAGQRVDITFYGGSDTSRYVRRIYRGRALGEFDGYYQIAMGANFSDTGAAFTGYASPPSDGSIPSTAEVDTNYSIVTTGQGTNTGTIWITNKTTTGFTVNCATAGPAGGHVISWLMFRA